MAAENQGAMILTAAEDARGKGVGVLGGEKLNGCPTRRNDRRRNSGIQWISVRTTQKERSNK